MTGLGLDGYSTSEDETDQHQPSTDVLPTKDVNATQDPRDTASVKPSEGNGAHPHATPEESNPALGPALGPVPGPMPESITELPSRGEDLVETEHLSHTEQRQLLRDLTLPSIPNMSIPPSPPGSPPLEATARFNEFLGLRERGIHFNQRLANSPALRNPALMQRLLTFAGVITPDDQSGQYENSLSTDLGPRTKFPDWAYTDNMLKAHDDIRKRTELENRGKKRHFVPASTANGTADDATEQSRKRTDRIQGER